MKILHLAIASLALPVALAAQAPAPTTDPITATIKQRTLGLQRNIGMAFDSIPESKFSYKPTPAQLTVGYIAQHLASDNYLFCNQFGSMKATIPDKDSSTPDSVKATWPKDSLVAKLRTSLKFCEDALGQLNDKSLADPVTLTFGTRTQNTTRAAMALGHALDLADHYSQIANYMRLNNMLPPSAQPRPRPGGAN